MKIDFDDPRQCSEQHSNLLMFSYRYIGTRAFNAEFSRSEFGKFFEVDADLVAGTLSFLIDGTLPADIDERSIQLVRIRNEINAELQSDFHNEERRFYFYQMLASISWILLWARLGMDPYKKNSKEALAESTCLNMATASVLDGLSNPILRKDVMEEILTLSSTENFYWDPQPEYEQEERFIRELLLEEHALNESCFKQIGVFLVNESEAIAVQETCSLFGQIIEAHPTLPNCDLTKLEEWMRLVKSAIQTTQLLEKNTPSIENYLYDLKYPPGFIYEEE